MPPGWSIIFFAIFEHFTTLKLKKQDFDNDSRGRNHGPKSVSFRTSSISPFLCVFCWTLLGHSHVDRLQAAVALYFAWRNVGRKTSPVSHLHNNGLSIDTERGRATSETYLFTIRRRCGDFAVLIPSTNVIVYLLTYLNTVNGLFLLQDLIAHGDSAVTAEVMYQVYTARDQTGAQLGTAISLLELRRRQNCSRSACGYSINGSTLDTQILCCD